MCRKGRWGQRLPTVVPAGSQAAPNSGLADCSLTNLKAQTRRRTDICVRRPGLAHLAIPITTELVGSP